MSGRTVTLYAIRHKPSGGILPTPRGRAGRGGSHVEPCDPTEDMPRLFPTRQGAKSALGQWLRGRFVCERGHSESYPGERDYYEDVSIIPQPLRIREDMEIVPVVVAL